MSESKSYKPTHGGYPTSVRRLMRSLEADLHNELVGKPTTSPVAGAPRVVLGYPIGIVAWEEHGCTVYGVENIASGIALCYHTPHGPIRRAWQTPYQLERFCEKAMDPKDPDVWADVSHTL